MIAQLTGKVADKPLDTIVLDVQGVGYGLFVTTEDWGKLLGGETHRLFVYEHIREQAHDLFGFLTQDTKKLFEQLLSVNGVGPKMALSVLSTGTADEVRQAIAGGDVKSIQKASGVGKRVAERVVVELKDKVGLAGVDLGSAGLLTVTPQAPQDDATQALVALGYSADDAVRALAHVPADLSTEERVKQALRGAN